MGKIVWLDQKTVPAVVKFTTGKLRVDSSTKCRGTERILVLLRPVLASHYIRFKELAYLTYLVSKASGVLYVLLSKIFSGVGEV
jgi:hypothetical protein